MMTTYFIIVGLVLVACLIGLAIDKLLERRIEKKQLKGIQRHFGSSEPGSTSGHTGYVESKYALIHIESNKIIIDGQKSIVVDTIKKMYSLELTSVDVSSVENITPYMGVKPMVNMILLSHKLDEEGIYRLSELNKEEIL